MSNLSYYLLWLAGGLLAIAILSAGITRHLRLRLLRRLKAVQVLDALARYSDWVAAQGRALFFQGDVGEEESPLEEVRRINRQWLPELSAEAAEIFAVHSRLIDFLWTQQMLRVSDPEAWLESDHEKQFMDLWRMHLRAMNEAVEKLKLVAGVSDAARQTPSSGRANCRFQ